MKTDEKQIRHGVALLAVTILILAITGGYMAIDRYLVGDEVVTYGMANSTDKGWMPVSYTHLTLLTTVLV